MSAKVDKINVLNRLLTLVMRSFPQYQTYASPRTDRTAEAAKETLDNIIADQQALADRISERIQDLDGRIRIGDFPMEYTDTHDLNIEHVIKEAIVYQRQDIAAIEACVEQLAAAPEEKALAEEVLGMAKGHLERLESATSEHLGAS